MAIAVLAVVIFFLFDNLREKRSVSLTKHSGIACFKTPCSTLVCCETQGENLWARASAPPLSILLRASSPSRAKVLFLYIFS